MIGTKCRYRSVKCSRSCSLRKPWEVENGRGKMGKGECYQSNDSFTATFTGPRVLRLHIPTSAWLRHKDKNSSLRFPDSSLCCPPPAPVVSSREVSMLPLPCKAFAFFLLQTYKRGLIVRFDCILLQSKRLFGG